MFIIAMAFISLGYTIAYWGAVNIKHWDKSVQITEAAPLGILFGITPGNDVHQLIHPVPFPYKTPDNLGATTTPSSSTGSGNGAQLSPNYPGGPNGTIPTPGIPA